MARRCASASDSGAPAVTERARLRNHSSPAATPRSVGIRGRLPPPLWAAFSLLVPRCRRGGLNRMDAVQRLRRSNMRRADCLTSGCASSSIVSTRGLRSPGCFVTNHHHNASMAAHEPDGFARAAVRFHPVAREFCPLLEGLHQWSTVGLAEAQTRLGIHPCSLAGSSK